MSLVTMGLGDTVPALASQAIGAGNPKLAGTWVQVRVLCAGVTTSARGTKHFRAGERERGRGFSVRAIVVLSAPSCGCSLRLCVTALGVHCVIQRVHGVVMNLRSPGWVGVWLRA
jgi:hypothetical protein